MPPQQTSAQPPPPPDTLSPAAAGALGGAAGTLAALPVVLGPAAAAGAAAGVSAIVVEQAIEGLVAGFAAFMRRRTGDVFPVAMEGMMRADPAMDTGTARRLAGLELEYEAEYQRKALARITADLRIALANPDAQGREQAIQALMKRERRYQQQREEAIAVRALARGEQQVLKRVSPQGAFWMLSDYVKEHTLDCLALAGRFWPWEVLEREGPPRHHGCPCYLISLSEAKNLGLMTDADVPVTGDAIIRARRALANIEEARVEAAAAVARACYGRDLSEGLVAHAKREMKRVGLFDKGSDYEGMIGNAVVELMQRFAKQGHSGGSAAMVRELFHRLGNFEALTPLTDDPGEWNDVSEMSGRPLWQNNRDSSAFSEDGGKTYTLLADKKGAKPRKSEASMQESAYSLEEGKRGSRKAYDKRYDRGTTKGGEFRPRRGGAPGRPTLGGVVGRGMARAILPRSPLLDRERGRYVNVHGHPVRVPERAWARQINGVTYTSPAGGTNVYRDGKLVSEPGVHPVDRAMLPAGKRSPGATVTDVPADRALNIIDQLSGLLNARRDPVRRGIRDRMQRREVPVEPGAGPEVLEALRQEGFTLGAVGPGEWVNMHHEQGKLRLRFDNAAVAEVVWAPAEPAPARRAKALRRPPRSWEEHTRDALALADQLGEQYDAKVRVPSVMVDEDLGDHAGRHEWSGVVMVGVEARSDVEAAASARAEGRHLDDFEARGAYASAWVTAHEVGHGVNPIPEELFEGADANLEEALTEEASHPIALTRLRQQGQPDVVKWALMNPDALPVVGVYLPERGALADLLDRAGIKDERRRLDFVNDLKFRVPPAERFAVLADALAASGDFENWDAAYDHAVGTMDSRDAPPRPALPAGLMASDPPASTAGVPADVGVAYQRTRDSFVGSFPDVAKADKMASLRAYAREHGADASGDEQAVRMAVAETMRPAGVSPEAPWVQAVMDPALDVPAAVRVEADRARGRIDSAARGYNDPVFVKKVAEHTAREHEWTDSMRLALSYGVITPAEARDNGFFGSNVRMEQFGPLPEHLYHVTTARSAVISDGRLRSRLELDQIDGHGLGAGDDSTVSFTSSKAVAENIRARMLEGRQVARGEITAVELLEAAERGDNATRPYIEEIMRGWGAPDWKAGDDFPTGVEALLRGLRYANTREITHAHFLPTVDELDAQFGEGNWWAPNPPLDAPAGRVVPGTVYVPASADKQQEDRFDLFKKVLFWREYAGGPPDPLFMSTDVKALAATDPSEIAVLDIAPIDDGHGFNLQGPLAEWRTWTGGVTRITAVDGVPLTDPVPDPIWDAPASVDPESRVPSLDSRVSEVGFDSPVQAAREMQALGHVRATYRGMDYTTLLQTRDRVRRQLARTEADQPDNHDALRGRRRQIEELTTLIALRKRAATVQRRMHARAESDRTGILAITRDERAALLSAAGDVYRDAGLIHPDLPRPGYRPDLFIRSDLSGQPIRHYVELPDGRRAHPDELTEALRRGRIIVAEDLPKPEGEREFLHELLSDGDRATLSSPGAVASIGNRYRVVQSVDGKFSMRDSALGTSSPVPQDFELARALADTLNAPATPESPGTPLMVDREGQQIRVGDPVKIAGLPGSPADSGVAIAADGRRLRYVTDKASVDPMDRERETPMQRATRMGVRPRVARSWDPRVEPIRQIDENTAVLAQMALGGDHEAEWELARRMGDMPADDPLGSAIHAALPALEPVVGPTGPLAPYEVDEFLAGATYGAVLHHGTTNDLARAIIGGDPPEVDKAHKGRMYGEGFYASDDRQQASQSARKGQAPGAVLDVAVRLENPLVLDGDDTSVVGRLTGKAKQQRVTDLPAFVRDQLKAQGYDGVVRRWPDGSTWVAVFDPDGRARAVVDAPALAQMSPSSNGPTRVHPDEHGPGVGLRYERRAEGLTVAEALGEQTAGRETGHFGTGVYFLSRDSDEAGLDLMDPEQRVPAGVDLGGARLHRPESEAAAWELHDTLRMVNDLALSDEGLTLGVWTPRLSRADVIASLLPVGADGLNNPTRREMAVRDAVTSARADREAGLLDADSASTRVMRALGYDGVDVRHLPELDNAVYGSVVYRPVMMDGGQGSDHMLSTLDGERWIADPPAGGWSGLVFHGTTPEAAAAIEASGFDFERSRGYGLWFADEPIDRFGAAQVHAAVRLERVAGDDDMARIREGLDALPPAEQAAAIRERLLSEGFDGYRGSYGDGRMVVAVVNPDAVRVVEPQNMEQRGDGAVVGGARGRWVWISGMYRHIKSDRDFEEAVGGVQFISPVGSTFVYRLDSAHSANFSIGDKVLARNLDDNGWRTGTVRDDRAGGGSMVSVDWDGGSLGIMSPHELAPLVSKPRWNNHVDVRDPRYGGTRREGSPEPRRRAARRRIDPAPPPPPPPPVDPALTRLREQFPVGTRVQRGALPPYQQGVVRDHRMSALTNEPFVEVAWDSGTSWHAPREIQAVSPTDPEMLARIREQFPIGTRVTGTGPREGDTGRVELVAPDGGGNILVNVRWVSDGEATWWTPSRLTVIPAVDPEVQRVLERLPVGSRVRLRNREGDRVIHGEVKGVEMSSDGRVQVEVEWATGTTSTWWPPELERVPPDHDPDWRDGQRVRLQLAPGDAHLVEGVLSRQPGSGMVVRTDTGLDFGATMETLRPVEIREGQRVTVHPENGIAFDGVVYRVIDDKAFVEKDNGDREGAYFLGRLDVIDPPTRTPNMGVLIDDDVRAALVTMNTEGLGVEPVELAPGVWYHPESAEIAHGFKLPDRIVLGPSFFSLGASDRDYQLHKALGQGLAQAMQGDPEVWQEAQNAWTAGSFSAGGRHLDRYDLHGAIATAYARMAAPPDLERIGEYRDQFPDAMRLVALAAERNHYPLDVATLDWANGRNAGGPEPEPAMDHAGRFASMLVSITDRDERLRALERAGFSPGSATRGRLSYSRSTDGTIQTIELDGESGRILNASTQTITEGRNDFERGLHGQSVHAAAGLLTSAGWTRSYVRGGSTFVSPDGREEMTLHGDHYGSTTPLDLIYVGRATLEGQQRWIVAKVGTSSESALEVLRPGLDESVVRQGIERRWRPVEELIRGRAGIVTFQSIEQPNSENVTAHQIRVKFENGQITEVGLPDAGDIGITPMGANGFVGQEYGARIGAVTGTLRREYTEREGRRTALAEQVRTRIASGTEPFDGTEDALDVHEALRRLGFNAGNPRNLQNGGVSVTFKNRRNGAKIIARFGPRSASTEEDRYTPLAGRTVVARSRVEVGSMVGERQRVHGHLPTTEREFVADALGRSDELAARLGITSVTTGLRFNRSGSPTSFNGFHGWDGIIVLGSRTLPALMQAQQVKARGGTLTDQQKQDVYQAYKLMQHELNHGLRTGSLLYSQEDGMRGFEEALTEELAHVHMVDWMRDHGLDEVNVWAESVRGRASSGRYALDGSYQVYRDQFKRLLDRAGVPQEGRTELFIRWKHHTGCRQRMDELAGMISQREGIGVDRARREIGAALNYSNRRGSAAVAAFRPILTVDRGVTPEPARPGPGPRPSWRTSLVTNNGDALVVGDTFRGAASPNAPEGTLIEFTSESDPMVKVRWKRTDGQPDYDQTYRLSSLTGAQWQRTSIHIDGQNLRAGDRFTPASGRISGTIVRFEGANVHVTWDEDAHRTGTYSIASAREAQWRKDGSAEPTPTGSMTLPNGNGELAAGVAVLVPPVGRRTLPYRRAHVVEITESHVTVRSGDGDVRYLRSSTESWITVAAQERKVRYGTRVEVRGSRGTFTGVARGYVRGGQVLIRRDGATRGSRYDITAVRVLEPDPGPTPGPTPPGPSPAPTAGSVRLSSGGTVGVGARMRGAATGKLCTVISIDGGQIRFRREDGTTGTYGGDQFKAIVITNDGDELKKGDVVRGPSLPGGGAIEDIDWTEAANPKIKVLGMWHPARTIKPANPSEGSWMKVRDRRGNEVPVVRGTKMVLRDGTIAEARERRMIGTWPDVRAGKVQVRGESGPRMNSAFEISAEDVVGIAGEQPIVPDTWGMTDRLAPREVVLRRLGDQHYRRVRTQRQTAQLLGSELDELLGREQVEQWWKAQGLPTRRVSGDQRAVVGGKSVPFTGLVSHLYGRVFESEDSMRSLKTDDPKSYEMLKQLAGDAALPWPNWQERVRPAPPVNAPPGPMWNEAVLRATWTGTFGRKGYRSEIVSVYTNGTNAANIDGVIYNARGTRVGNFTRRVGADADGNPTVYHSLLQIQRNAQGSGFAGAFNRHAEAIYRAKGVKKVTVSANLDVGGYAWAATGFDFNVDPNDTMTPSARAGRRAVQALGLLNAALRSRKITQAEYNEVRPLFVSDQFTPVSSNDVLLEGKIQHAWELAHLGPGHAIGKKILLGKHWGGVKHLLGPDRSPFAGG